MQQLLTIFITAITTYSVMAMMPIVKAKWNAFRNAKKRTKTPHDMLMEHNMEELVERMNELEGQINNIIEVKYTRERNRKSNIRREVREYLKELQND